MLLIACFLGCLFAYGLLSARLERTVLTAPLLFTAAGMVAALAASGAGRAVNAEAFLGVAEVGLVLLLFSEASRTGLSELRSLGALPGRLLSTGMLLTIGFGGLAAKVVLPGISWWEAGILAAILAPTDAGLGQVIVTDARVPARVRQALSVEAGLNDGLSVPFLLFFVAMVAPGEGGREPALLRLVWEQLGLGAIVGAGIGFAGGWLLFAAHRRKWVAEAYAPLAIVVLPLLCLLACEVVHGSMFIAAFVGGLAVQVRHPEAGRRGVEFAEGWGQALNLSVFFLFGLLFARDAGSLRPEHVLYAVLSLTVVRMLPVAVALLGAGWSRATVAFMGWFGPRGLASIVLGLVYFEEARGAGTSSSVRLAVGATVWLSIVAHGLSARPGIALYERRIAALPAGAPERDQSSS